MAAILPDPALSASPRLRAGEWLQVLEPQCWIIPAHLPLFKDCMQGELSSTVIAMPCSWSRASLVWALPGIFSPDAVLRSRPLL
jgi:hypothetical protein